MPRRGVKFFGERAAPKREPPEPPEPPEPHVCEVCGTTARWGHGVRLLQGQAGRWYCFQHRPEESP
jgi:hypothetical protein